MEVPSGKGTEPGTFSVLQSEESTPKSCNAGEGEENNTKAKEVVFLKTAITQIPEKVKDLLDVHAKDLEEAWANVGDEGLSISFSIKIGYDKQHKGKGDVTISFSKEKIKDTESFEWNDLQLNLKVVGK